MHKSGKEAGFIIGIYHDGIATNIYAVALATQPGQRKSRSLEIGRGKVVILSAESDSSLMRTKERERAISRLMVDANMERKTPVLMKQK